MNEYVNVGLTNNEVLERKQKGKVNFDFIVKTKSIPQIISENVINLFNILNFSLAILVLLVDSYKNLLFIGIVICNTFISTIQAIRSKRVIDKLSIINSQKVSALRDKKQIEININDIVLDDIILYKPGNQIVTDAIILEGNIDVNESFITGEADLINYQKNDKVKSGGVIVAGRCKVKVISVGDDNYTSIITKGTKYVKKLNSILMKSLNQIIKMISIAIIPMGLILFYNQSNLSGNTTEQAVLNTVAALIGMIPEGLILLTSTVLAVSVIRLSKLNVLVQELYCIEMLARVDTIFLDKTGTITTGKMNVEQIIPLDNNYNLEELMGNIVNCLDSDNETISSLKRYFRPKENYHFIKQVPFSPVYKYSGISFKEGHFIIGAPEVIYKNEIKEITNYQKKYRVLLVCSTDNFNSLNTKPIAIILIRDEIRKSSKRILDYLNNQKVDIKIISGDNINTLNNIATRVGLKQIKGIDLSHININYDTIINHNIFGRVSPDQKREMVKIMQDNNHVVAMTGDGVNDVLALKQADCSITFKSATDAARNVSQLVLMDSTFDSIPKTIEEGRRVINNIQKSATLFLSKTIYAFLLTFIFMFVNFNYPFEPIQLTLTNFFTIGVPAFVLALEPNINKVKGNFLSSVFSFSFPTAITIVLNIIIIMILSNYLYLNDDQVSTLCVIMTGFTSFLLLIRLCLPFNRLRFVLISTLIFGFLFSIVGLKTLFSLTILNHKMFILISALIFLSTLLFNYVSMLVNKVIIKYHHLFE